MSNSISVPRDTIVPQARPSGAESESSGSLAELRDTAGRLYRQAKDRAVEQEHKFEDYVRGHPVKSVLVAAGVGAGIGLLAGLFLSRSRG